MEKQPEIYKPSMKEIAEAEEMMSEEQRKLTEERFKQFLFACGILDSVNTDSEIPLNEENKVSVKNKISLFEDDKLLKMRESLFRYSIDPTLSGDHPINQQIINTTHPWVAFVGEAVEKEFVKRGLLRRKI
jgi:hypothetical protein